MKTQKQKSKDAEPGNLMDHKKEIAQTACTIQHNTDPTLYLQAQQFALAILADPILKDLYTKMAANRCTAYSLAVSEFLALGEFGQWIF